ncbi:metallophosphoesterase, partial [Candidatus Woesearchaeota archaeon]|nr:metallophosphoesterase [Candidatus Woesearchaeota archaeon]
EIPPASQWEGRFAVVIPEMPEAPSSEQVEPIGSQLSEEEIRLADSIRQSLASSQTRTFLGQKGIMIVEDERGNMNLNFMGRLYPISFASPTHAKSRYYFQVADLDGMRISLFVGDKTDPEDIKPDNIFLEVSPIEPKKPDPSRTHSQEEVELKKKEIESILGNYPLIEEFFLILKAQMADPEAYHSAILQVIQDKKGKSDKNTEKSVDQLVDSLVDRFEISHELRSRVKDYVKQMSEMIMPVVSRLPHTRTMIKDSGEGGLLDIVLSEGHTPMFYRSAETGFSTKDELWAGTEHVHVNLGSPGDFMYGNIVFIFSPQGLQESEDSFYLPRDENYGFYTSYGMPTLSLEEKISAAMDQDDAKRLLAASIVYNHLKTNLDSGLDITYLVQNSMHFNQIISVLQGMSSNSVVGKIEGHIPNSIPLSDQIIMAPVTDREWITRSLEACTGCQGLQVYFMEGSDWESYSQGRLEAYLFSVGLTELPIRETTEVSGATVKVIEGGTLEDYKTMYEKKAKSAATKSQPSIQRLYTSSGMTQTQRRNFRKTMIDSLAEKHGINIPGKAQGQVLSIIDEDLVAGRADLDIARIKQVLLKDTKLTEVSIKIATDYLSERYGDLPQSEAGKKLYGVEEVDRDFVPILETAVLQDRVDTIDDLVNELGSYVDAEMTRVGPSRKESVRSEGPVVEVSAKRLVSIGDLHASTANLRKTLVDRGIMDESGNWIAEPGTVLLQIGDLIDGGSDTSGIQSAEAIKLLKDLESQAREKDGAVVVLMGNHEVDFLAVPGGMWHYPVGRKWRRVDMLKAFGFTGDIGFVQEGKKTVFDEGTGEIPKLIRALASNDQRALQELREINPQAMQYIDWLLTRPMIAKVNVEGGPSLAFVHGGPTAEFMKELQDLRQSKGSISINDVNELLARRLSEGLNTPYFTTDSTTILAADKSDKAAGGQARFPDFLLDPGLLTSFLDILGADLLAGGHNPFYGLGNVEPSDSILPGIANQITSVNRIGLNSQFIKLDVDQKRERQGEDVDVQETASMISHFYIDSDMMSEVSQSGDRTLLSDGESPSDISAEQSRLFRDKMRSEVRILDFTRFRQIAGALGLQYSDEELISAFRVYEEHLLQNGLIDSRESILDMHIGVQAEKAKVC